MRSKILAIGSTLLLVAGLFSFVRSRRRFHDDEPTDEGVRWGMQVVVPARRDAMPKLMDICWNVLAIVLALLASVSPMSA